MPTLIATRRNARASLSLTAPAVTGFSLALPWLLVSLVMAILALVGQVPGWTLFVFGLCTVWRYVIAVQGKPLPSMVLRMLLFLPVAAAIVKTYGTSPGATGMLTFLIALLSLKVLELRSSRDFTVVSLLGYFLVLCGFFYNQSLALCLYLCVALLVNTVALIRCHSGGRRDVWPAVWLALGLTVQAIPLVVLLFVIFPRVEGSFLRRLSNGNSGMMGMSEHLHPGSVSSLAQSNEPAFRAKINGGENWPERDLYWRGLVLDVCEASMSWKGGSQIARLNSSVPEPTQPGVRRIEQQITLVPQGERWMFALDRPVGIRPSSSIRASLYNTDVLESREAIWNKIIYTVVSESNPVDPPISQGRRDWYTHLPPDVSDRVKQIALGWRAPGRSDEDVIRAAEEFFRDGKFTYTLTPDLLPEHGAIDEFLFKSRRGFCEHFAAAFSTMMRAAGMPARIVIGYQGGEYNYLGGYYNVQQSDAHAWSEVWVQNKGWQRVDPTAVIAPDRVSFGAANYAALSADGALSDEARLERLNALNAPGSLRWLFHSAALAWDTLDQQWNVSVLGYDQDQQQSVLQRFGIDNLSWFADTAMTLAAVFTILTFGTAAMRTLNRGPAALDDPVRRVYERFCRRLAAVANVTRVETEGPLDFARRAAAARPDQTEAISSITNLYVAARYAPAASGTLAAFRDAVRKFRPRRQRAARTEV